MFSSTKGKTQHRFGQMKQMLQDELREEARADAAAERHAEEAQYKAEDAPAGEADAIEIMSPGEVVVEGVMVEEPAAAGAKTAGEVFGFSEQTVSVPPGDVGLTFDDRDWRRPLIVKEVAAGSPLFGRVQAGATLVAVDGMHAEKPSILNGSTKAKTLTFQTGMDLGFEWDSSVAYVGREGPGRTWAPLMSADAVVEMVAMDRGLFDAANAAKARTHWLHGGPGNLAAQPGDHAVVQFCCVPPLCCLCSVIECLFAPLVCECWQCQNCCCNPHKDMAFPDWADRALVFTDKGVVGRREFTGPVNAITWDGFRIEDVRIRTFDAPCLYCGPSLCCGPRFDTDPLETACYFGCLVACCRCALCRPAAPGLYRATISSIHKTRSEGPRLAHRETREGHAYSYEFTASIEVLALARSPDDLRSSLRAAKEKYSRASPKARLAEVLACAPKAPEMAR